MDALRIDPLKLPGSNALLLGQPCTVNKWAGPQVSITCSCDAKTVLLINGFNHVETCPGCKRGRMLKSYHFDVVTNAGSIEVVDVAPPGQ